MFNSVMFDRRAMIGQAGGSVRINPRYVVTVMPYQKPGDQVADTQVLLSTGDTVVVAAPPSEVDRKLKGGR